MYTKTITKLLNGSGVFTAPDSIFKLEVQFIGKKEFSFCKLAGFIFALKSDGSLWKINEEELFPLRVTKKHFTQIAVKNTKVLAMSFGGIVYELDEEWESGEIAVSEEDFPESVEQEIPESNSGFLFTGSEGLTPIPGHRFSPPQSPFYHVACKPFEAFNYNSSFGVIGPLQGPSNSTIRISYTV